MKRLLTLLTLLFLLSAAQAESIATIQLRNRPAAEVIPIVQPMLQPGESISGQGFKIFLRASRDTQAEVREMVAAIDQPVKMLQISVFQGSTRGLSELGIGGNLEIESGDGRISVGTGTGSNSQGGSITYSNNGVSDSVTTTSTQKRLKNNPIHQIRVSEGNEAYIETGKQIPYFSGAYWTRPRGTAGGVEFKDVVTGFYVLPRVSGDRVTLQVRPFKNTESHAGGGNIQTQSASTTISGSVGQWLLIGGVSEQLRRAQSGTGTRITTQSRNNESIWIKADLVP